LRPFAFVYSPVLLLINFNWPDFLHAMTATIIAIIGLSAAYTGYFGKKIGWPAFIALNLFSISLVFANPVVTAISVPVILLILYWHYKSGQKSDLLQKAQAN
jgi:TRAP-type uncharacterized transport system fused permease subunit